MKVLVLLSGGLDSATVLAELRHDPANECSAVGYDYGQRHSIELSAAAQVARHYDVAFEVRSLPWMPLINDVVFAGRNLLLAAMAIAEAAANQIEAIAVGCNASDWRRFPDCRPHFWQAVTAAATAYDVKVLTPLLHISKRDVVERARKLNVPIDFTWSCYSPDEGKPCRECLACKTREEALA